MSEDSGKKVGRREFMGRAAAAASFMIMAPQLVRGTAANSALRVGLLGCGGRGRADAEYTIETGKARLVALADIFQDQLDKAKTHFDKLQQAKGYAAIDSKLMFKGPKAYQEIANSKDVDVVIITTPPFFHPQHLAEVVTAGKHIYCEKPVAVDPAGCISVLDSGRRAQGKLSLEVGFQLRNAPPYVEQVKRIHDGALGTIVSGTGHYYSSYIKRPSWPGASMDEHRLRNWVHYRILSGDIIVEQNIHVVDVCNWVLQGHPIKASASGSNLQRPDHGDCYTNYSVVFEYPNNVSMTFGSTQFNKGWWDVGWQFFGTKGVSETHYNGPVAIYGDNAWKYGEGASPAGGGQFSAAGVFHGNLDQADPEKKKSFVESILNNQFHNQAEQGVESAISCMMARHAAYTGEEISYEAMAASSEEWEEDIDLAQFA
ncbi:MAG TPA: Gfo/Idh/MocA family oxidoreductase [Terriglobia bacterium]|nr:Gfo/Idh/MocA family oxidoreductase [Terriglobia bacterium]